MLCRLGYRLRWVDTISSGPVSASFACWDVGPDVNIRRTLSTPLHVRFLLACHTTFCPCRISGAYRLLDSLDDSMPGVAPFYQALLCCKLHGSLPVARCYQIALNHMYMWWFRCGPHLGGQLVTMLCLHVRTQGLPVLCLLRHDVGNHAACIVLSSPRQGD